MMIRGRHRGLPYKLDRAVVLPGERREGNYQDGKESQPLFERGISLMPTCSENPDR